MAKRIDCQRNALFTCLFLVLLGLGATPAFAYVGPGAGLTAVGTMVAVILALLLAVIGFVWYPLKRAMRKRRAEQLAAEESQGTE